MLPQIKKKKKKQRVEKFRTRKNIIKNIPSLVGCPSFLIAIDTHSHRILFHSFTRPSGTSHFSCCIWFYSFDRLFFVRLSISSSESVSLSSCLLLVLLLWLCFHLFFRSGRAEFGCCTSSSFPNHSKVFFSSRDLTTTSCILSSAPFVTPLASSSSTIDSPTSSFRRWCFLRHLSCLGRSWPKLRHTFYVSDVFSLLLSATTFILPLWYAADRKRRITPVYPHSSS